MTDTDSTPAVTGVPFVLNGQNLVANDGELLIDACERNGIHIPRFCYQERMTPVGMCRMCLVEVDTGRGAALQPSCMLPVTPDMKVETESESTQKAQSGILELLLINHPLDCPVCDKGGECPLQDTAYSFGPGETRFVEEKRHYEKPIPISDLVNLDRERCILCDRCTRFSKEVAGDPLIHFIDRGNETHVNTFPDHPFSSYFSGNTVQICPVGALTASPYRFKARPWDLTATESTSTVDSSGARIALQSSRDELVRVLGVDSEAVNWGWLSDKERFGYEAANSDNRLTEPFKSTGSSFAPVRWNEATKSTAEILGGSLDSVEAGKIGIIGGARLTVESQYAWSKLLGETSITNVDANVGDGIAAELALGLPKTTIAEALVPGSVVVLLSADPKEELPTLFLRLRHAVKEDGVSIIEITPRATSLAPYAAASAYPLPGSSGAVAEALAKNALSESVGGVTPEDLAKVAELISDDRPVTIIVGRSNLAESAGFVTEAVGFLLEAAPQAKFLPALRRGNLMGALEMGLTPDFKAGGVRSDRVSLDTEGILAAAAQGQIDTLLLLGADPLADFPDRQLAVSALDQVTNLIAVDTFFTESSSRADIVLPAAGFGEVDGSFLNLEGRLTPIQAKVTTKGQSRADWMIAVELAEAMGVDLGFSTLEELRADLSASVPSFADIDWASLNSASDGPLINQERSWSVEFAPRAEATNSEDKGLSLVVDRKLWDLGTMVQNSATLHELPSEAQLCVAVEELERLGLSDGESVTIESDRSSATVLVFADATVPIGTAWVAYRAPGLDIGAFISASEPTTRIRVTS